MPRRGKLARDLEEFAEEMEEFADELHERAKETGKDERTIRAGIEDAMSTVATERIVPEAKRRAPESDGWNFRWDTPPGELKRSITSRPGSWHGDTYTHHIGSTVDYAPHIEFGTAPHTITASNEPELHFFWKSEGRWVRTQAVRHPGNRAYAFLRKSFRRNKRHLVNEVGDNIDARLNFET